MTRNSILPTIRLRRFVVPAAAAALGLLWYFQTGAAAVPRDVPLNWDMAGHLLAGQEFQAALRAGDPGQVVALCRVWSVYPPLWHLLLGAWLALFGAGTLAVALFQASFLVLAVAGGWLGFTADRPAHAAWGFLAAACLLPASAQFGALLHAPMLDAPAVALALLSLGLLARWDAAPSWLRAGTALAAVMATILVKYNVGLALLAPVAALAVKALVIRDRRRFLTAALLGAAALALWAAFLSWKVEGWHAFRSFADNRANTLDWSAGTRALAYARLYARLDFDGPAAAVAVAVLAAIGVRRWRHPFWLVAAAYGAGVSVAIARHPYFLDRLLLPVVAALAVLAGFGVMTLVRAAGARGAGTGRAAGVVAVAATATLVGLNGPALRLGLADLFPPANARLAPVSRQLQGLLGAGRRVRVVGTFNNFSENWVRILWRRSGARGDLELEYPYLGTRDRTGLDAAWTPRYFDRLQEWLDQDPPDLVVALVPDDPSPWRDTDYRLWNAWKLNYARALGVSPALVLADERHVSAAGMSVLTFAPDPRPVDFGAGWGKLEDWGRWILDREAELVVPCGREPATLVVRAATFDQPPRSQTCRVFAGSALLGTFTTGGDPWQWRDYRVALPSCDADTLQLRLELSGLYRGSDTDPRLHALPVRSIRVETPDDAPDRFTAGRGTSARDPDDPAG